MLYYCPACGHWEYTGIREAWRSFVDRVAQASQQPAPVRPEGYACPHGHGLMEQIERSQPIMPRPQVSAWQIERLTPEERDQEGSHG